MTTTNPTATDLPTLTVRELLDLYADFHSDAENLRRNGHSGTRDVVANQSLGAIVAEVERRTDHAAWLAAKSAQRDDMARVALEKAVAS